MTFSSIVRKNFSHNFNKYISFYFVNSLIIAMLFMYGSLMFNPIIIDGVGESSLYDTIAIALVGVILFSIVFITYTNVSFLKNRGKEFGMYLTLGMTTKDLKKLIFIENLGIMAASLVTGILSGALFGRLFYMGLNKILSGTTIAYNLSYKSFLLSAGIFGLIFIGNFIFNIFYIKKMSILDVIKSSSKKEVGKSSVLLGVISLVLLIIALYCLPKTLLKEMFKEQSYMSGVFVAITLIAPYMIIGSFIGVAKSILSRSPKLYNKNLLILSNLSHRFLAYKNLLYMLSLLVAGAIFFVGWSYSSYSLTRVSTERNNPYDIMFVETDKYNKVQKEDIEECITKSGGEVEKYNVLEYIEVVMFREEEDAELSFWSDNKAVISETNYNEHMNTNMDVNKNTANYVTVYTEEMDYEHPSSILTIMDDKQLEEVRKISVENNYLLSKEDYNKIAGEKASISIDGKTINEEKGVPFINARHSSAYDTGKAFILDDSDYELLKSTSIEKSIKNMHLIDVKNGNKAFEGLIKYLRVENGLDDSYWNNGNLFGNTPDDERGNKEAYRPIYIEELIEMQLNENGMMLFTMIFIGLLFIIANGVVLYYKVLSDIQDEEERMKSLSRIGVLQKEVKSMISKELAITFFVPIVIGGGLGLYYLYLMVSNSGMADLLIKKSIMVLVIGAILQTIFYIISKRKYIKDVM